MKHRNWRELAEAVGFVTVVGVLVMIAIEERAANRIAERVAEAEAQRSLAAMQTALNMARSSNLEVAKVYAKMAVPQGQLITVTDNSQMRGIAQQFLNMGRTAQFAYDRGVLPEDQLRQVRRDLEALVDSYPGLHPALLEAYGNLDNASALAVFQPIAELAASQPDRDD